MRALNKQMALASSDGFFSGPGFVTPSLLTSACVFALFRIASVRPCGGMGIYVIELMRSP